MKWHHLKPYYGFRPLHHLAVEEQQSTDWYPWLFNNDRRRNLTDREILEKCVDLGTPCLNQKEKEQIMDMP